MSLLHNKAVQSLEKAEREHERAQCHFAQVRARRQKVHEECNDVEVVFQCAKDELARAQNKLEHASFHADNLEVDKMLLKRSSGLADGSAAKRPRSSSVGPVVFHGVFSSLSHILSPLVIRNFRPEG